MNRDEVARLLNEGKELVYNWRDLPLPQKASLKRSLILMHLSLDPPDLYPAQALQEMPDYVFRQKMARIRPFHVMLFEHTEGLDNDVQFGFCLEFYLPDLDEVDQFLSQFGITVCDFTAALDDG